MPDTALPVSRVPDGWAVARLGDLCAPIDSVRPAVAFPDRDEFRYVDLSSISDNRIVEAQRLSPRQAPSRARQRIAAGDTLFSCVRVYLENTALVPPELDDEIASTAFAVLRPLPGIDPRYVYWLTRRAAFVRKMTDLQRGNSPPAVLDHDVRNALVPVAPAAEQRRIVARVEELFGEIEAGEQELEKTREEISAYRRAILKAAVTGELSRVWHENNSANESDDELRVRLRNDRRDAWSSERQYVEPVQLNVSDLPALPPQWLWVSLDELICDGPRNGYSPPSTGASTGTKSLKLTATTSGYMRLDGASVKRIDENVPSDSRYWLRPGDILLQRANTAEYVGVAAVFDGPANEYIYPDLMMRIRLLRSELVPWVWRVLNSPATREWVKSRATGTAGSMPKIKGEIVRAIPIPLAPMNELKRIIECVDALLTTGDEAVRELDAMLRDSRRLRQSVLSLAFCGKLVPQHPGDEPASALLQRLNAPKVATTDRLSTGKEAASAHRRQGTADRRGHGRSS